MLLQRSNLPAVQRDSEATRGAVAHTVDLGALVQGQPFFTGTHKTNTQTFSYMQSTAPIHRIRQLAYGSQQTLAYTNVIWHLLRC